MATQRWSLGHSASVAHSARRQPFSSNSRPPQPKLLQVSATLHVEGGGTAHAEKSAASGAASFGVPESPAWHEPPWHRYSIPKVLQSLSMAHERKCVSPLVCVRPEQPHPSPAAIERTPVMPIHFR